MADCIIAGCGGQRIPNHTTCQLCENDWLAASNAGISYYTWQANRTNAFAYSKSLPQSTRLIKVTYNQAANTAVMKNPIVAQMAAQLGIPTEYMDISGDNLIQAHTCECGGWKVGYKKGDAGHSRWCPDDPDYIPPQTPDDEMPF